MLAWFSASCDYQTFCKVSYLVRVCFHITEFTVPVNIFSRIKRNGREVLMGCGRGGSGGYGYGEC